MTALRVKWQAWCIGPNRSKYLTDWLALGAICLLFIARCAIHGGGVMWIDELLSFNLIHDPSVPHMLAALGDQADGAPPVFYLLGKVWAMVFSGSPASLRMFSTIGFCVGFALLWSAMRHAFSFFSTAAAFIVTISLNEIILFESSNLRFYGLLFALISLAVLLAVKFCESNDPSRRLLVANALAQGTLVLCHPLGGFYGAAVMLAVGISDLLATPSRVRVKVLASYCIGWLAIFLWWQQFFHQAALNEPHSSIPVPSLGTLSRHLVQQSLVFPLLLFLSFCWLSSMVRARAGTIPLASWPFQLSRPQRVQLLIALSLISVAPLFWVLSHLVPSNSIFLPRYLIGTTLGWTILLAHFVTYVFERHPVRSPLLLKGVALLFMSAALTPLCAPLVASLSGNPMPDAKAFLSGISDRAFGHIELPIVCPAAQDFLARTRYAPDAGRYYYLLNWDAATASESSPYVAVENHILFAIKRHYCEFRNIVNASEFLPKNPAFLVLDVPNCHWCILNLRSGSYKITRLLANPTVTFDHEGEWPMLLVERHP